MQGQVPKIDTLSRFPSVFDDESQVKHPVLVVSEQVRHEKWHGTHSKLVPSS